MPYVNLVPSHGFEPPHLSWTDIRPSVLGQVCQRTLVEFSHLVPTWSQSGAMFSANISSQSEEISNTSYFHERLLFYPATECSKHRKRIPVSSLATRRLLMRWNPDVLHKQHHGARNENQHKSPGHYSVTLGVSALPAKAGLSLIATP